MSLKNEILKKNFLRIKKKLFFSIFISLIRNLLLNQFVPQIMGHSICLHSINYETFINFKYKFIN